MSAKNGFVSCALVGQLLFGSVTLVQAQSEAASPSEAQQTLDQAAKEGKYTFLLFYKQTDDATRAMAARLKDELATRGDEAVVAYAQVGNPAVQALVAKYDVSRAPMPMTLAIAPNGALTAIFAQKITSELVSGAFVTPTMMATMKSLQEGKLVLVVVQGSAQAPAPIALQDFQADPHFKDRLVTISMRAADPQEAKFVGQMQLDPKANPTQTVLLAPPGVLVGKFGFAASKAEIAAALVQAGKCCDDPNCKYHQPAPASVAPRSAAQSGQGARSN